VDHGRYGGYYCHGSGPGILNAVVRRPWAKYAGSIGVIGPLLIFFYYVYILSWLLGFSWYSLSGELMAAVNSGTVTVLFGDYIGLKTVLFGNVRQPCFSS
jgi:SNF family Na+-dependent transporter